MGKIAFVFAGQGAQYPGMGRSLYDAAPIAKTVFDTMESAKTGSRSLCFDGDSEAMIRTENTQPALFCTDLSAALALDAVGIKADMAAGFSLGELPALTYAGVLALPNACALTVLRGKAMQQAAEKHPGGMAAILRLEAEQVEELCASHPGVYPVNYNSPGQTVVAGTLAALPAFYDAVAAAGGKAMPLAVGGGFHSPFMADASAALAEALQRIPVNDPRIPIHTNVNAAPYTAETTAALLTAQVKSPVRWEQTVRAMLAAGADTFVECGPGKVLSGLIGRIAKAAGVAVQTYNCEKIEDVGSIKEALSSCS